MLRNLAPIGLGLLLAACGSTSTNVGGTGTREVLRINSSNLPAAFANEPYTADVQVVGGVNPYSLRVSSGALPPGVKLQGMRLVGTPSKPGRYEFIIEATDANLSTQAQSYAITVGTLPPADIKPAFPNNEFRADTRVPVKIEYPRGARAARLQWQLPQGVQVSNVATGSNSELLMWKQTGNTLTLDLGFTATPSSGSNVALVGLKFAQPTRLDASKRAFTILDSEGRLIAQKTFNEAASSKCLPASRLAAAAGTKISAKATPAAKPEQKPAAGAAAGQPASSPAEGTTTNPAATEEKKGEATSTPESAREATGPVKPATSPAPEAAPAPVTDSTGIMRAACATDEAVASDPAQAQRTAPGGNTGTGAAGTAAPAPAEQQPQDAAPAEQPEGQPIPEEVNAPVEETAPAEGTTPAGEEAAPNPEEATPADEPAADEEAGTPSVPVMGEPGGDQ